MHNDSRINQGTEAIRGRQSRRFPVQLAMAVLVLIAGFATTAFAVDSPTPAVTVYKSPTCGCCEDWVTYLREEGFDVTVHDRNDMNRIKAEYGVFRSVTSCHTALVDGYVIEGHVPVGEIGRLLAERPNVLGLSAPGMPQKAPGMQASGKKPEGYDILSFDDKGRIRLFKRY